MVFNFHFSFGFFLVSRPQSSEGDHSQQNQQQNGFSNPVPSASLTEDKQKPYDGTMSDSGLLIDQLGLNLTQSDLQQIHSCSDSALMSINEKGIATGLNDGKASSSINVFKNIKVDSNGYGPRGSLV